MKAGKRTAEAAEAEQEHGQVYFRVVGDADRVWAGPHPASFRQIAAAWNRYRAEVQRLPSEAAQLERVAQLRRELAEIGALPTDLPPAPEPLWSLLVSEAEFGMAWGGPGRTVRHSRRPPPCRFPGLRS